uniref:Uncharacterized protein n=1 Tax=Octopus bimaculoides TaxID=37653 RepID=A0A0L8FRH5_OCTBM
MYTRSSYSRPFRQNDLSLTTNHISVAVPFHSISHLPSNHSMLLSCCKSTNAFGSLFTRRLRYQYLFLWKAAHIYVCLESVAVVCHGPSKENCKFVSISRSFCAGSLNNLRAPV